MLRPYLMQTLREHRLASNATLRQFEETAGLDRSQLSRLETGDSGRVMDRMDALVAAYAEACGMTPRELWQEALGRWAQAEASGVEAARQRGRQAVTRHRAQASPSKRPASRTT